ncbi:hypothetical protein WDZ92_24155 [Nostoc sp. NIES-2111]
MSKGKLAFRQSDLKRVLRSYIDAGMTPQTILGANGVIVFHGEKPPQGAKPLTGALPDNDAVDASWADLDDEDAKHAS